MKSFRNILIPGIFCLLAFYGIYRYGAPESWGRKADNKAIRPKNVQAGMVESNRSKSILKDRASTTSRFRLTPDGARQLLEDIKTKVQDIDERSRSCAAIIEQLCKSGYSSEAWKLIEGGAGQVRNFELNAFFLNADITHQESLSLMRDLEYRMDYQVALSAFLERLEPEELSAFLEDSDTIAIISDLALKSYPNLLSNSLASALSKLIHGPTDSQSKRAIDLTSNLYKTKKITQEAVIDIIGSLQTKSSFEKFDTFSSIIESNSISAEAVDLRKQFIGGMVRSNPELCMKKVTAIQGEQGVADLQFALNEWATIDSKASSNWYVLNKDKLNLLQQDGAALAFFKNSLDYNEYETALLWAKQVNDPKLRNAAEKVVKNKRK